MAEALGYLPLLLAPVVALLFLNLRLSRRLRYPHDLLVAESRRGLASFLPRWLRTYYDVLLDAAAACALAFALAAPAGGRPAAAIDCSRSMLAGDYGARPLDGAVERLRSDPALRSARPFALAFDPAARAERLVPVDWIREAPSAEAAARRLENELDFFSADPGRLAELRRRGYGDVTFLTDELGARAEGFAAIETGFAVGVAAWPAAARAAPAAGSWIVTLAETGPRGPLSIQVWDQGAGAFAPLPPRRYAVEDRPGGRAVAIAEPGLYRLAIKAPQGDLDPDFAVVLRPATRAAAASGPFSERMMEALGYLERSAAPTAALVDVGAPVPAAASRPGSARIETLLLPADGGFVIDPALTGGRPVAAALEPPQPRAADASRRDGRSRFALGPSSISNDDLALAYHSRLRASEPPPFLVAAPAGAEIKAVGAFYLARTPRGLQPVIAPPEESFPSGGDRAIRLPPREGRRWPWALALALLAAAKLAAWARLSGKSLFREAGAG